MKNINYTKVLRIFIMIFLWCFYHNSGAEAACLGSRPVWGTGDDRASCADKQRLKREAKQLEIKRKEMENDAERQRLQNNRGRGSGTGNTNVFLDGLQEVLGNKADPADLAVAPSIAMHQFRVELMPFVIPGAYQVDDPGQPEQLMFNGAAYEYFFNRNISVGIVAQKWARAGGKKFDSVTTTRYDESGDAYESPVFFPGAIERIDYTQITIYANVNAYLTNKVLAFGRAGVGHTRADIKYDAINSAQYPHAHQPGDNSYSDSGSLMLALGVQYIYESGSKLGFEIRYHNARYDTMDYREYLNLGSVQAVFGFQFGFEPWGTL